MYKRWLIVVGLVAAFGIVYVYTARPQSEIVITDGRAVPMGASGEVFMVTLNLRNDGAPTELTRIVSPSGASATFMNPDHDGRLILPGGDTAHLAMDGAHVMLRVPSGTFPQGSFHSLTLGFDDGSESTARILNPETTDGMAAMDHHKGSGIELTPSPAVFLAHDPDVSTEGFDVEIRVENFEFVHVEDSAPHVDGQGHGHIYLNGLKLGRLYDKDFTIGTLLPGDYVLTVVLNSNDHRPYLSDGTPIKLTYSFSL